jgi:hypothetical protein
MNKEVYMVYVTNVKLEVTHFEVKAESENNAIDIFLKKYSRYNNAYDCFEIWVILK